LDLPRPSGRPFVLALGALGIASVAALDLAAAPRLDAAPLYLLPVGLAAYRLARWDGLLLAALAALARLASALLSGPGDAPPALFAGSLVAQAAVPFAVALGAAELAKRAAAVEALSRTDDLTGLPNLPAFRDRAVLELDRARRWSRPLTLAYVDLDGLGPIRRDYGQEGGDDVLRTVAVTLRSAFRSTDFTARVGDGAFVLLLPETDERGARVVLEKADDRLREDLGRGGWPVTPSLSAVTATGPADAEALLERAGRLAREARRDGAGPPHPTAAPAGPPSA
jgi:diguanylate cyclase (GGDEF)-like protein